MATTKLLFSFPPSVNGLYATDFKTKRRFKTKRYVEWCAKSKTELYNQDYHKHIGPVSIGYVFTAPDKRLRDLSNMIKGVEDFLVQNYVIRDDSDIKKFSAEWGITVGVSLCITDL